MAMNKATALQLLAKTIEEVAESALQKYRTPRELNPSAKQAASWYGLTNDPNEAGFILPDGTMLDLSGKNIPANLRDTPYEPGQRNLPHDSIGEYVLGPVSIPEALDHMGGAVRVDPGFEISGVGVEASRLPNRRQLRRAADMAMNIGQPAVVELSDLQGPAAGAIMDNPTPGALNRWFMENTPLLDINKLGRDLGSASRLNSDVRLNRVLEDIDARAGALGNVGSEIFLKD